MIAGPEVITGTGVATDSPNVGDWNTDTLSGNQVSLSLLSLSLLYTVGVPGMTSPPIICGYNTGQHMYVPACPSCVTITLDIDTGTSATRNWQIKVTQYECGNLNAPEQDCLQYHTAIMGNYPRSRRLVYL